MKRRYITPTATLVTFGGELMRTKMVSWSVGRVVNKDDLQIWNGVENHPVIEDQDWLKRPNDQAEAWGTDIWGDSE